MSKDKELARYIGVKIIHAVEQMKNNVPGYFVRYEDGYESWSPVRAFAKAYRRTDSMNFGLALEAAKKGRRIARKGWNGKNMYVYLTTINAFEPFLVMRTADGAHQPGWLASQADMLADDWYIVED